MRTAGAVRGPWLHNHAEGLVGRGGSKLDQQAAPSPRHCLPSRSPPPLCSGGQCCYIQLLFKSRRFCVPLAPGDRRFCADTRQQPHEEHVHWDPFSPGAGAILVQNPHAVSVQPCGMIRSAHGAAGAGSVLPSFPLTGESFGVCAGSAWLPARNKCPLRAPGVWAVLVQAVAATPQCVQEVVIR